MPHIKDLGNHEECDGYVGRTKQYLCTCNCTICTTFAQSDSVESLESGSGDYSDSSPYQEITLEIFKSDLKVEDWNMLLDMLIEVHGSVENLHMAFSYRRLDIAAARIKERQDTPFSNTPCSKE